MKKEKELTKNYVSKCCKSTFRICYKDDVEGEYYTCDKCQGDCDLIKMTKEICECGHSMEEHNWNAKINAGDKRCLHWESDKNRYCKCKKFKEKLI